MAQTLRIPGPWDCAKVAQSVRGFVQGTSFFRKAMGDVDGQCAKRAAGAVRNASSVKRSPSILFRFPVLARQAHVFNALVVVLIARWRCHALQPLLHPFKELLPQDL